jgi:hypothetical protein
MGPLVPAASARQPGKRLVPALLAGLLLVAWLAPGLARAQQATEATSLIIGAPSTAALGQPITVQAVLVDSTGHPISKATIDFTLPVDFLTGSGSMVLVETVTDKDGRVRAEIANRTSGAVTLQAEYHGNDEYAASSAAAPITVTGDDQQYAEDIGLHIPFFNTPPALTAGGNITVIGAALWPSMTGWPIAAVLIIIWALYGLVVFRIFQLARANSAAPDGAPAKTRSLP